ncbi:unnamed protein product, partial [Aureobasidium mustum]
MSINQEGQRQTRACQTCRVSKVRCSKPDDGSSCARCSKAGRPCVPFEESNKRQKRLDTRSIDDFEARLSALAHILQHRGVDTSAIQINTTERTDELDPLPAPTLLDAERTAVFPHSSPIGMYAAQIEPSIHDIIDDETTSMIFDHFRTNMLKHLPFVAFPSDVVATEIRQTASILLLAILDAAGDGYYDMETSCRLRRRLTEVYSAYFHENSADGIIMLQAQIISVLWNRDPEPSQAGSQLNVFQLSHTAANMATGMGLESRLKNWSWNKSLPYQSDHFRGATSEYQFSTLEVRRLWLACYYICSKYLFHISPDYHILTWRSASLATQTPSLVPWSRQMDECLEVLSSSPAALASDKVLCAHVRLQHILEETETQLSSSYGQVAIDVAYRVAERQLAEWAKTLHAWNDSLKLSQQFVTLYIHELAMTKTSLANHTPANDEYAVIVSPSEFSDCLAVTQNSLDFFLCLDIPLIRTLPTSYLVQVTHTTLVLVKLHLAAARLSNHRDAAQKISETGTDAFLRRLLTKFSGWGPLWPAQKLVETFRRLRELLRQCGDQRVASDLAWLNTWTLEGVPSSDIFGQTSRIQEQPWPGEEEAATSQSLEIIERVMLSTFDEDAPAWRASSTDQNNSMQNDMLSTLPSASLDATQLIDWFGTDLSTSTFDFDGNLQLMTQFFE